MKSKQLSEIVDQLEKIKKMGWIKSRRQGNVGGIGNTLEDLLGIDENNLQIPDYGEWELKSQRSGTNSLVTLFHSEPEPRKARIVPQILLPKFGWPHQEAGLRHPIEERSFRQTINAASFSDRGFIVKVDRLSRRVKINFDYSKVDNKHLEWKESVLTNAGDEGLNPIPYWTFDLIENKLNEKLKNVIFVTANSKLVNGEEFFKYEQIELYLEPSLEKFLTLLNDGFLYVDFDARTGHNHGTKFRVRTAKKNELYKEHAII